MTLISGFNLPPGCFRIPGDTDPPCEVCGRYDDCICPECPICSAVGDPICYDGGVNCSWCGQYAANSDDPHRRPGWHCEGVKSEMPSHGMTRSAFQIASKIEALKREQDEIERENDYWDQRYRDAQQDVTDYQEKIS